MGWGCQTHRGASWETGEARPPRHICACHNIKVMTPSPLISKEVLLSHIDYTRWASSRLVAAAGELHPQELIRDFGTADKSVLGSLVHVFAADRVWMGRIKGNPPAKFIDPDRDMHLSVLENEWPPLLDEWTQWLTGLSDARTKIAYQDLKGNPYETPAWQIVLHVVNHGTHHRGQAQGFLRAMGRVPKALDLIAYYREQNTLL
jgi:uncharacterized damage-inducible protein DinB